MKNLKSLAIIPARGGSKRIPGKNIRDFLGKPIISYSIDSAIQSELFDEVMVSTDSEEIKRISENFGAKVPFLRSSETSNDFAGVAEVVSEVIYNYKREGKTFQYFCCIFPTAPFVQAKHLEDGYRMLI